MVIYYIMPPGKLGGKTLGKTSIRSTGGGTVESKHYEQLEMFDQKKLDLPKKKKELIKLEKQLQTQDLNDIERRGLLEKIEDVKTQIYNIENNVDEYEYLLNVGPLLFKYFDSFNAPIATNSPKKIIESVSLEVEKVPSTGGIKQGAASGVKPGAARRRKAPSAAVRKNQVKKAKVGGIKALQQTINIDNHQPVNRAELLDEFKSKTNPNHVRTTTSKTPKNEAICEDCGVLRRLNCRESVYICPECGVEETTLIDTERQSYKDPPPEVNYFAYKRINHFNELLAQFQAKESTNIPKEVVDTIRLELRKERKTVKDLDYDTVKRYLKKHSDKRYNQYYDHIFHIIHLMNGMKPLSMTPEMEERLRSLFLQIQEPFEKFRPPGRKNFISYYFVFYKFCELLGYKEYLPYFPLLKSKEKLYDQEKIWEKICNELGWPTGK